MTKILNAKQRNYWFWSLDIEIYLEFGAWDLDFFLKSINCR